MRQARSRGHQATEERGVYPMSVATDLLGMHAQTLRKYEREGLVEPARTTGGSRRFSARDVGRLRRIGELADDGVNVEGIRRILELEGRINRLEVRVDGLEHDLRRAKQGGADDHRPRPRKSRR